MCKIVIHPSKLAGRIMPPPSKSISHRAVICAALAGKGSSVSRVAPGDDLLATRRCLEALGAQFEVCGDHLAVNNGPVSCKGKLLDCIESGSTLRFLLPVALALGGRFCFAGQGNLGRRPLGPYLELFDRQGIRWSMGTGNRLDLTVEGYLKPGRLELPGDISSQFFTGLLLALPLLEGDSELLVTSQMESAGYLDLTLDVMAAFGVRVQRRDNGFFVPGKQAYQAAEYSVEGDYSQAAVFLCAGALGADVGLVGLRPDSLQGDRAILDILSAMGSGFQWHNGVLSTTKGGGLHGAEIDVSACPDIAPPLAVVCALAAGDSRMVRAGRLRLKECDRLHAICRELGALGADIREGTDSIQFRGGVKLAGGKVWSHKDHRIAMMLTLAASFSSEPVELTDPACVSKSYPDFYGDWSKIGGIIR